MRYALYTVGLATLAALWLGPLPDLAAGSFAAHMTLHMGVVAVAAPLLALGVAGTQADPVRRIPTVFAPIPLAVLELVVVWGWHAPGLHQWARQSGAGFLIEQGSFLACGLLLWLSAVGGDAAFAPGGRRALERPGAGIVALLMTSMHMTLLGALLALSPRPLYDHAEHPVRLPPMADQHLGGAIMLLVGGASYLAGGVGLSAVLLRAPPDRAEASAACAPAREGRAA